MTFVFPASPSKIAFAGDWHMNHIYAERAIRYAAKHGAEVIVHCGDFGYTFRKPFIKVLESELARQNMTLVFVDGNHDNHEYLESLQEDSRGIKPLSEHIAYLPRGFVWEWSGKRFLALGGAYSVDRNSRTEGVSWWRNEVIAMKDAYKSLEAGSVDYIVAHDCPSDEVLERLELRLNWGSKADAHSAGNRKILKYVCEALYPTEMWCGHYHVRTDISILLKESECIVHVLDRDSTEFHKNMDFLEL